MAALNALRPALRALSLGRPLACTCARPAAFPLTLARPFSSSSSRFDQASWDALDTDTAFQPASVIPDKHPAPVVLKRKGKKARLRREASPKPLEPPPPPPLPPLNPPPTVDTLHPLLLHQFRHDLTRQLNHLPSSADLDAHLRPWLRRQSRARTLAERDAVGRQRREEVARADLDLAWEWERQAAKAAGRERTPNQQAMDREVLDRLKARMERKREIRELQELEKWEVEFGKALVKGEKRKKARERAKERDGATTAASASSPSTPSSSSSKRATRARPNAPATTTSTDKPPALPEWQHQKLALAAKFPGGWSPPKRLSREAMDLVRQLARQDPSTYTTPVLAARFKVSPEAVRRILKSRFVLSPQETAKREAQRKEERKRQIREWAPGGEEERRRGGADVWVGDRARQNREVEELKRRQRALAEEQ
ncbi:hypothetical protein JCM8097_002420 [Rhodosporidiobolus ruineniae]